MGLNPVSGIGTNSLNQILVGFPIDKGVFQVDSFKDAPSGPADSTDLLTRGAMARLQTDPMIDAESALIQLLSHENPYVISSAVAALGKSGIQSKHYEVVVGKLRELGSHERPDVVANVKLAQIRIGVISENVDQELRDLLQNTNEEVVINALALIGEREQKDEDTVSALTELLSHKSSDVVISAATALGKIAPGNEAAVAKLARLLSNNENLYVITMALRALERINLADSAPDWNLTKKLLALTKKDRFIIYALPVLEQMKAPGLEALRTRVQNIGEDSKDNLEGRNPLITENVHEILRDIEVIRQIGQKDEDTVSALAELLSHKSSEVVISAATVLGKIAPGNEAAVAKLVSLLGRQNYEEIVIPAIKALEQVELGISKSKVVAKLTRLLSHKYSLVVCPTAKALSQILASKA